MQTRPRILNVDDDEIGRFTISQMLLAAGFDVDEATNGTEALLKAQNLPDLILLDVRMPDLDGFEVCRRIKADPKTAGIMVLHLSATQVDSQAIAHGLNWGADGYLTEPIAQGELIATVRAYLRIRQAEAAQRFLAEASGALASMLDVDALLAKLASIAATFFQALCIVDVSGGRGELRTMARAWAGRAGSESLASLERDFGETDEPGVFQVARSGRPMIGPAVTERAKLAKALAVVDDAALEPLLPAAFLSAPLVARTRNLGVITIAACAKDRQYTPRELTLLEDLAGRSALLLDNARLYEQAQKAVATRENMLAIVSHDLKDPLNSLVMGCEMLRTTTTDAPTRRRIEIMRRSAMRMDSLIHDLLDLASLDRGTFSVTRLPCVVDALVDEVFETFVPLAAEKNIELKRDIEPGLPQLPCDRQRVHQVLSNLLSNALKFTPKSGRVELSVRQKAGQISFLVSDSGPGIAAEQLPYVFDRFWQANRNAHVGTGLGLSIAKGIVEAHGGTITVESTTGTGSKFEFVLPVRR
ncbi:MAG TPA: ATP-binding protein [Polyangiales bacterium]|nr:ATP-binding protein [Polyangiales bacterium]